MIDKDLDGGVIRIYNRYDVNALIGTNNSTPVFNSVGDEFVLSFTNIRDVLTLKTFKYDTIGITETRFLKNYFRVSLDGKSWSNWIDLNRNIDFPDGSFESSLYIDIKWVRVGSSNVGSIRLIEYEITGLLERNLVDSTGGDVTVIIRPGDEVIWKAPFIFKVFKVDDIEILSSTGISDLLIKYRFSQDSGRSWSNWEHLTKENITTVRINPIRFFQIEYSIKNNSNNIAKIQDINLIGDFTNVSKNYYKTNLYGIRECCMSNIVGTFDENGDLVAANNTDSNSCSGNNLPEMSIQDKANLYNPYNQGTTMDLLNKLSSDAEQVFGHKVEYFCTDPDSNGQDHSIHEYQLYNVVCKSFIKASVDGNNFPDSQIVMNQFDLSLFESMVVHITKKQFKEAFGPHRRPSKEDFLYFCDVNRIFQVEHAQQFRNFNNAAIYYKLVLKKYTQKANVIAGNDDIKERMRELTNNTTLDELMGIEKASDKASVANKQQLVPLSSDPIRLSYKANINREVIINSSTTVSKSNYDLSSVDYRSSGVMYKNLDPILRVSDNISYTSWFRVNNYISGEFYNLLKYYDINNSIGFDITLSDDRLIVRLNSDTYNFDLLGRLSNDNIAIDEDIWYCILVNINQRDRNIEYFLYKRNVNDEDDAELLNSNKLRLLYSSKQDIVPIEYQLEETTCEILGSDMSITNIRLFNDIIPSDQHNKILNQYVIGNDSRYLIFADNATMKVELPKFPYNE